MSGFSSQRVKGTVKSVLVDDEIVIHRAGRKDRQP